MHIEFIENEHLYLVDGVITPSVSQIIREVLFKDMYQDIPKYILENAAQFGNNVHKAIENDSSDGLAQLEAIAFNEYKRIQKRFNIKPLAQEIVVHYDNLYCGTLDMIAMQNELLVINDIKTTYKVQEEYLSWQLSFYKYAYERMGGDNLAEAYCIWLPKKELGEYIKIPFKTEEEVLEVVRKYHKENGI